VVVRDADNKNPGVSLPASLFLVRSARSYTPRAARDCLRKLDPIVMSANAAAPAAAAETVKSKKKGKQNDGINNRLQIVMRYVFRTTSLPATGHYGRFDASLVELAR